MNDNLAEAAIAAALASDWEKASKLNLQILKDKPDDLDTLNRLGRAYTEMGNLDKAVQTYRKVLKIDKYNQIAQKNIQKLEDTGKRKRSQGDHQAVFLNYDFIEEPGKTKIVSLVNLASPKTISSLRPATSIILKPKRHTVVVCLIDKNTTYIGSLPDDLGHRLETLLRAGNTYEAYIKSTSRIFVTVFIKELTRSKKFHNVPSFVPYLTDHQQVTHEEPVEEQPTAGSVKKPVKPVEDQEEEEDHFSQKVKQLHGDEEPES